MNFYLYFPDANTSSATHLIPNARITKTSKLIYDAPKPSTIKKHSTHIDKQQSHKFRDNQLVESTRSRCLSSNNDNSSNANTNTISLTKSISSTRNIEQFQETMLKNKKEREKWSEKLQTYLTKSINKLPSQKSETNQNYTKVSPINLNSDDDSEDAENNDQKKVNCDAVDKKNLQNPKHHIDSNAIIPENNQEDRKINKKDEQTHSIVNVQNKAAGKS